MLTLPVYNYAEIAVRKQTTVFAPLILNYLRLFDSAGKHQYMFVFNVYSLWHNYLERMLFVGFSTNYQPIVMKFCTGHFQGIS